jgi:hypothetical protein
MSPKYLMVGVIAFVYYHVYELLCVIEEPECRVQPQFLKGYLI